MYTKVDKVPLPIFLDSDKGHELWDSPELRLVTHEGFETVFVLKMNEYIEYDELHFIDPVTNQFTPAVDLYVVTGYVTIDGTNYIFIEVNQVNKLRREFYVKGYTELDGVEAYYIIDQDGEQVSGIMNYNDADELARMYNAQELDSDKFITSPYFNVLVNKMLACRYDFQVINLSMVTETDTLAPHLRQDLLGHDIRCVIYVIGNEEPIVYEFDETEIKKRLDELNSWC